MIIGTDPKTIVVTLCKIALGLAVLWLFFRWFERAQVFIPSRRLDVGPDALGRAFEDVTLTTADHVRINAWFFPAESQAPHPDWVILLCHGNAGNMSHRLDHFRLLLESGVNVMAFDYRGYGRSEGRPSESGTVTDALTAYRWLRQKGFAANRIIALGESLGGGVASELALRETLGGLILQSSFTSVADLGAEIFPWLPVRWLSTIHYDTQNKLPQIKVPVLILHSRTDSLVPFHHAQTNFARANPPKWLWELDGDHNEVIGLHPGPYRRGIEKYLQMLEHPTPLP
jgi:pimeloyl-ACP methyl ester carboxylesterase